MRPRGLCRWIGHNIDAECQHRMGISHCRRCGDNSHDLSLEQTWVDRANAIRWRLGRWAAGHIKSWREWCRCPACGGRCGRHDADRCIPF